MDLSEALRVVFGDDSEDSDWLADSFHASYGPLASAILDAGGEHSEHVLMTVIPRAIQQLSDGWLRNNLDKQVEDVQADIDDYEDADASYRRPWRVSDEYRKAFLRLLPLGNYLDTFPVDDDAPIATEWKRPTPKELIEGFVGTRRRPNKSWVSRQMAMTQGYAYTEDASRQFVKLRCVEPKIKRSQVYTLRGLQQAEVLTRLFKKEDAVKYVKLTPQSFFWTAI